MCVHAGHNDYEVESEEESKKTKKKNKKEKKKERKDPEDSEEMSEDSDQGQTGNLLKKIHTEKHWKNGVQEALREIHEADT